MRNEDGHTATFLSHILPKIKETDRPDESTAIYVLHAYHLWRMGGKVDVGSLVRGRAEREELPAVDRDTDVGMNVAVMKSYANWTARTTVAGASSMVITSAAC